MERRCDASPPLRPGRGRTTDGAFDEASVVIPCYNERETIATLVAAVHASPVADLEVIVVDDGSHDGTRDVLRDHIDGRLARPSTTRPTRARALRCAPGSRRPPATS